MTRRLWGPACPCRLSSLPRLRIPTTFLGPVLRLRMRLLPQLQLAALSPPKFLAQLPNPKQNQPVQQVLPSKQ